MTGGNITIHRGRCHLCYSNSSYVNDPISTSWGRGEDQTIIKSVCQRLVTNLTVYDL